jgi:hypothetical protein
MLMAVKICGSLGLRSELGIYGLNTYRNSINRVITLALFIGERCGSGLYARGMSFYRY